MPLHIVRNDIVNMRTQAIVCPSNSELRIDGGAGGAVALVAGVEQLQKACDAKGGCPVGSAVVTPAFDFPADMLVHAVGPVWCGGNEGEVDALHSCVIAALTAAAEAGAETIAVPLLSAGLFGFPSDVAISAETQAIEDFLDGHDIEVWLVLYANDAIRAGRRIFNDIEEYIDDVYVEEALACNIAAASLPMAAPSIAMAPDALEPRKGRGPFERRKGAGTEDDPLRFRRPSERGREGVFEPQAPSGLKPLDAATPAFSDDPMPGLAERLGKIDESFAQTVLRLIDERRLTDVEVYKRANMSRQLFAKIRKDDGYRPTKKTACALAFALGLNHDDALMLLSRAGFTLSHSSKFDIIVEYFLMRGIHDIYRVNEALFAFDQQILG